MYYQEVKTILKINNIDPGVTLFLYKGNNITSKSDGQMLQIFTGGILEGSQTDFELPGDSEFFILTAVPKYNQYQTSFNFTYFSEGEPYPFFEWYYYQLFVVPKNGGMFFAFAIAVLAFVFICLICCLWMCAKGRCRCCRRGATKIGDRIPKELSVSGYM